MEKTTAERQEANLERQDSGGGDGNGQRRVSMWLDNEAAFAMARLASRYGVTRREVVENMLLAEDERVPATMKVDTRKWDRYFTRKRIRDKDDRP